MQAELKQNAIQDISMKEAICVSISKSCEAARLQSLNPVDFLFVVEESVITWINIPVDDINLDAEKFACQFGFDSNLVKTLIAGYHASYHDVDVNLAGSTIIATYITYWIIKSRGLLPKKPY